MRVLLDSNVIIDIYTNRSSGDELSRQLLLLHKFGDVEFWVSASSFTDMFFILSKFFSSERIQEVFEESLDWLHICATDSGDIASAAAARWSDFEDCVINAGAEKVKADYILTRNKKDFTRSSIPTMTPTEFFDMLERTYHLTYEVVDI